MVTVIADDAVNREPNSFGFGVSDSPPEAELPSAMFPLPGLAGGCRRDGACERINGGCGVTVHGGRLGFAAAADAGSSAVAFSVSMFTLSDLPVRPSCRRGHRRHGTRPAANGNNADTHAAIGGKNTVRLSRDSIGQANRPPGRTGLEL
ncbi:hypothetical protein Fuma_04027 [Fuerstiella marisgermanici]|uniref:Uncharacterized protein n=2 Tax=Fuerstiella marisgermanici TaxID=1891926 RepID=A0A1P8WK02_9PLAN|nr:hypothetical protein Fuma_04027 [Fuerstiella marisgermanici]